MHVLGTETPVVKSKETTPVQAPPSEESRQKTDSGKTSAARVKTEPKVIKQDPVSPPEMTVGKPAAATPASQVTISTDEDDDDDNGDFYYTSAACCGQSHKVFKLFVCPFVRPCIPNMLTQYLEKYCTYFHQTFSIGAFWDKDWRFSFCGPEVKGQVPASRVLILVIHEQYIGWFG